MNTLLKIVYLKENYDIDIKDELSDLLHEKIMEFINEIDNEYKDIEENTVILNVFIYNGIITYSSDIRLCNSCRNYVKDIVNKILAVNIKKEKI